MTTGRDHEVNLSSLLGLNNRLPDFRLRTKEGAFLRAAANVDISNGNSVKRRAGASLAYTGNSCHSLWSEPSGSGGYVVDDTTVYRVTPMGQAVALAAVFSSVARGNPVSFCRVAGEVMFTDGAGIYTVKDTEASARMLGAPHPPVFAANAGAGGSLPKGLYRVGVAYQAVDGLELSPLSTVSDVNVMPNGTITVTGLPATWPALAARLVVYLSAPDGTTLYIASRLTAPATTVTISTSSTSGAKATTDFKIPTPAGRILRYSMGRLLVAASDTLWYSDVYSPALCTPTQGFIRFPSDITVMEPCDGGLFVVADATYWLPGEITQTVATVVAPVRAVFGTGGHDPLDQSCFWMSARGMAIGTASGEVTFPHEDNVVVPPASSGSTFMRESDGQRHLVSSLFGSGQTGAAAQTFMHAEVIRKGTTL